MQTDTACHNPIRRSPPRLIFALLVCALLVGCTTKLVYRHADWYLLWKIHHYVDLNGQQWSYVRNRLKDLLTHHQREALPLYEQFLNEVKDKSADRLTREEVDWIFERYHQLWADLFDRVLPDTAILLTSIDAGQVRHLERMLGKDNEKASGRMAEEPAVRELRRLTEALEVLREWLGPLTREQEQRVKELVTALPDLDRSRLTYVEAREQELFEFIRAHGDPQTLRDRLRVWLVAPERVAPSYGQSLQQLRESLKRFALAVDDMVTPRQRAHALARLQRLIDDIHSLHTS